MELGSKYMSLTKQETDEGVREREGPFPCPSTFAKVTQDLIKSSDPRVERLAAYATICCAVDNNHHYSHGDEYTWRKDTTQKLNEYWNYLIGDNETARDTVSKQIEQNIYIANKVAAKELPTLIREKEQVRPTYRATGKDRSVWLLYRPDGTRTINGTSTTPEEVHAKAERDGCHIRAAWRGVDLDDHAEYESLIEPLLADFICGGEGQTFSGSEEAVRNLDDLLTGKNT